MGNINTCSICNQQKNYSNLIIRCNHCPKIICKNCFTKLYKEKCKMFIKQKKITLKILIVYKKIMYFI